MTLGELIAAVVEYIYGYWPFRIVSAWEQGIRLRSGRVTAVLQPGIHVFWPLVGEIITETVTTDVNATPLQTVTTHDGVDVTFSLALKYRITDLALLYASIQDHDETVVNEVCACAASWVAEMDAKTLKAELGNSVYSEIVERLEAWGVELEDVGIYNLTKAQAIRLLQEDNS